jgi:hypothetical protein
LHWLRDTLYPQKLALTSVIGGGSSVGIFACGLKPRILVLMTHYNQKKTEGTTLGLILNFNFSYTLF